MRAVDAFGRVQQVMVVVPVDAQEDETQNVGQNTRQQRARALPSPPPCGTLSSSTMMVMRMAMTPSLNASNRWSYGHYYRRRYFQTTLM